MLILNDKRTKNLKTTCLINDDNVNREEWQQLRNSVGEIGAYTY